jgi:DNA-directed RNA polymerase alpha subunit
MKMLVELQDSQELLDFEKWYKDYTQKKYLGSVPINVLNLSKMTEFELKNYSAINTIYDLMNATDNTLLKTPNIGATTVAKIRMSVKRFLKDTNLQERIC